MRSLVMFLFLSACDHGYRSAQLVDSTRCFDVNGRSIFATAWPEDGLSAYDVSFDRSFESETYYRRSFGDVSGPGFTTNMGEFDNLLPVFVCFRGRVLVLMEDDDV